MKKTALISIAVIFLLGSFATVTVAGVDPQPFHQISALSLDVKIHGKKLNKMLDMPACDISSGEIRKAVVEFHKIGFRLGWLNDSTGQLIYIPDDSLWEDLAGSDAPERFKSRVMSIIDNIDDFLAASDPCVPTVFLGAVLNVRAEAVALLENVECLIELIPPDCGTTEIDAVCNGELCELIEPDQDRAGIELKGRSMIHLESDFFSEFTRVTMEILVNNGDGIPVYRSYDITEFCEIRQYPSGGKNQIAVHFNTFRLPIGPNTWTHYTIELHPMPPVPEGAKTSDSLWILTHGGELTDVIGR